MHAKPGDCEVEPADDGVWFCDCEWEWVEGSGEVRVCALVN